MRISVLKTVESLETLRPHWEELSLEAVEPNPFYEPAFFIPAFRQLSSDEVKVVVVWRGEELVGFFPLREVSLFPGIPLKKVQEWRHIYCYLSTPLVHRRYSETALEGFESWVQNNTTFPHRVEWEMLGGEPEFQEVLRGDPTRSRRTFCVKANYERAFFNAYKFEDYEHYLRTRSAKRRKSLRKKEKQLRKDKATFEKLENSGDFEADCEKVQAWADEFLELEDKGWKGEKGTSMASRSHDADFFREITREFFLSHKLHFLRLRLGGRTIASKCSFVSRNIGYAFRIAYDEEFSQLSPGLLLEIENIREMFRVESPFKRMDSCAAPNHPLFHGIWDDSRQLLTARVFHNRAVATAWKTGYMWKKNLKEYLISHGCIKAS